METIKNLLAGEGYTVVASADGIDVMVKALRELPLFCIIEVALPKIYGFEVCKRLKSRPETRDIKLVLVPSIYDKTKYRREPVSLYGADDYIEEHEISSRLIESINRIKSGAPTEPAKPQPTASVPSGTASKPVEKKAETPQPQEPAAPAPKPAAQDKEDEFIEKAKRLARTIINDIYLYNAKKVEEAIRRGDFYTVFAAEVREGRKLYENRIPQETRNKADFYKDTLDNFLTAKKQSLS
jgi:CheY-like chemotaxis protein